MPSPFEEDEELEGIELRSVSIDNLSQDQLDDECHANALVQYAELQRIILPENATRADAIQVLSKSIPENEYGLPAFFYRVDHLPYELGNLTQADADACAVTLDYDEGYPTFDGGHVFWQQLPAEPLNDFLLFQRYIDQAESLGLRQIQLLAQENNVPMAKAQSLYFEYFWSYRARAHDLFQVAADRKRRELRSRRLEDNHYKIADDLMSQLKIKLGDTGDLFKDLSGKEMLECLRLIINIQRVSAGLPQNGNAGATYVNPDAAVSGKQLMEDITKGIQRNDSGLGLGGGLAELLKDPNFAMEAQAIVLKVRHQNDPNAQMTIGARIIDG